MSKFRSALAAGIGPLFMLLFGLFWLSAERGQFDPARLVAQPGPPAQITPAQNVGLALTATVGLDQAVCATTTGLRVRPGARVYYCYTATNTGAFTFTAHTIRDTRAGVIWDRKSLVLAPGATINTVAAGQELGAIADIGATTFVTWTAQTGPTRIVTTTGSVRVDVVTPQLALTKTVGLDPATCATTITRTVLPFADAFYCLTVRNTGDITFTQHRLSDPTLGIARTFDLALAPGRQLTLTDDTLDQLGGAVDFAARGITRTITNTVFYTATTVSDFAVDGAATVSRAATGTVNVAKAAVAFTKTVGTSSTECATTDVLTVDNPATLLYYCARVQNTGLITLTHHEFNEPPLGVRIGFTYTLAPGKLITLSNATLLSEYSQSVTIGPYTVYNGANLVLDNTMYYTGTGVYTSIVTANAHAFAGANATPTSTATPTLTTQGNGDDDDDNPTDTPTVTFTPSFTPIPPTATPTFTFTPETPTITPTPTRSYAISFLATPTPRFESPLALPADQAATLAALDTVVAYEATLAAAQLTPTPPPSPLETPTPTITLSPTLTPTAAMVLIVVTNTPGPEGATPGAAPTLPTVNGQRPVNLPPPPPTPDTLLLAAQALDGIMVAAGWIWFVLGSLVFFTVAGVLVGLSFRQQERHRFDLLEPDENPQPTIHNPTEILPDAPDDDWPASLP